MTDALEERFRLAMDQFRVRNYDAAIQIWEELVKGGFEHPNLELYLSVARHERARQLQFVDSMASDMGAAFTEFQDREPSVESGQPSLKRVKELLAARKYEDALEELLAANAADPGDTAILLTLAKVHLALGRLREALTACEKATALGKDDVKIHTTLGNIFLELNEWDKAENALQRATELDEENVSAWTGLGTLYIEKRRMFLAVECLRKALSLRPGDINASTLLDEVLQARENNQSVISECKETLAEHPEWPDWQHKLGVAYMAEGMLDDALVCFSKALEINGRLAKTYSQRGLVFGYTGDHEKACEDLKRAVELADDYDDTLLAEATDLEKRGHPDEAALRYVQAMRFEPNYASRHIEMAKQFYAERLYAQAEKEAQKGISLAVGYPDGYYILGMILVEKGDLVRAVDAFFKSVEINPRYKEAILALVEALESMGEHDEAQQLVRRYRKELEQDMEFLDKLEGAVEEAEEDKES